MSIVELSTAEKQVLLHTLGLNDIQYYETEKIKQPYRNYFYTSNKTTDHQHIELLIKQGLMEELGSPYDSDSAYFQATEKGVEIAQGIATKKAVTYKPSRSKRRYLAYLHSETDEGFMEWLKNKYWDDFRKSYGC